MRIAAILGLLCISLSATPFILSAATDSPPASVAASAVRVVPRYDIADFLATTAITGAAFSPDENRVLFSSDASGVYNAYSVAVGGGDPVPLTDSQTNSIFAISYFPDDERILYTSDQGGNELNHVFVRETDGSARDLTPGDKLKAGFFAWAHDRRSFFVTSNERDNRFFDLYQYRVDGYERTCIYQNDDGYSIGAISRDERWLALAKDRTTNDNDIYLYDRNTKSLRHLTPHKGEISHDVEGFTADGRGLYLLTDEGAEFRALVRQDLETGQREVIEKPEWDVWYASLSESGRYLVVGINRDARTEIRIHDLQAQTLLPLPALAAGDITTLTVARSDHKLAFHLNGDRSPSNLYVYDLPAGSPRQLTHTLGPKIDPNDLVDGEVARFRSYDGVEIPGILYRPWNAGPDNRVPVLVSVHGGPGGQSRLGYNPMVQYLVNGGYAVFAINNRGSSGYGKTFYRLDDRKHGDADLDDCVASKTFLASRPWVDGERIGIIGGSYGGYMVLAALAFRPQAFAVGVDLFGVSNWVRTLESIPKWWEAQRQSLYTEIGDPDKERETLRAKSPLFHAENIRRPLMVLQGANDPRVLQVESDEIVAAARKNGVPVEYLVFDDEGHGFRKKENRRRGFAAIRDFCDQHLRKAPGAPTPKSQ